MEKRVAFINKLSVIENVPYADMQIEILMWIPPEVQPVRDSPHRQPLCIKIIYPYRFQAFKVTIQPVFPFFGTVLGRAREDPCRQHQYGECPSEYPCFTS
jgi:hypothetical protein